MAQTEAPASQQADVVAHIVGISPGSALDQLRQQRADIARFSQASYEALLEPADPAGISRDERDLIALRSALLAPSALLAEHYRVRLRTRGVDEAQIAVAERQSDAATPRLARLLAFTDLLSSEPRRATPADSAALTEAGFSTRDVVTVAQLIAFVSYQARLIAGLRALHPDQSDALASLVVVPSLADRQFTLDALDWSPWLPPVAPAAATPEQDEVVRKTTPAGWGSAYFALLAHDVEALRARTSLFQAIMYGPGGLKRADRELATVAVSRVNGCVYCASVHSRLYVQLAKDEALMRRLLDEGVHTELPARERAIVEYAVKLTLDPQGLSANELRWLREAGLGDLEILDATHAAALFAWANRLMLTLGEPVPAAGA
jgi:CMD domain protein